MTDVNSPALDNPAIVPDVPVDSASTQTSRPALSPAHIDGRRALISGLIAGAVIIFLILIGIPGGTGENDSLPPWFAWALFMLTAGLFAFFAARPRNPVEKRTIGVVSILVRGTLIGVVAAALTVAFACAINAGQRWQISGPPTQLADGLPANIVGVQDVFNSVTERTTAVLSGLSEAQLNPSLLNGTPRADPGLGFFLMACLLPLAGIIGSAATLPSLLREEIAVEHTIAVEARSPIGRWIGLIVPLLILIFIIANETLAAPANPSQEAYNKLIGGNAQLLGLLASFVLVATALLAVREANTIRATPDRSTAGEIGLKTGLGVALVVIFFAVGFVAPSRNPTDLLLSPRTAAVTQITGADGQPAVVTQPFAPIVDQTLFDDRRVIIVIVGVLFALVNVIVARDRRLPLRRLLALDILFGALAILPLYLDKYQQSVLLLVGINVLLGLGLNIVVGYAGLLDLGYVAFFAIGAYAYAFLSSNEQSNGTLKFNGNHAFATNLAFSIVVGGLVVAAVIGLGAWWWRQSNGSHRAAIRLTPAAARATSAPRQTATISGERPVWLSYVLVIGAVAIASGVIALLRDTPLYNSFGGFPVFVLGILVGVLAAAGSGVLLGIPVLRLRGDYLAIVTLGFGEIIRLVLNNLKDITGGPQGLLTIPPAAVGNIEISSSEGLLYLTIIGCLLVAVFSLRLKASRIGRAWGALSSDEDIAQAMGINITSTKVLAFAFGAAFAGVGGVIYAARQGGIFPDNFTLDQSINVLSLVIIGGMGSIPGVIVGALVLVGIPESLRVFASYRILAFGALLIAMTILRPRGILPRPPTPLEGRAAELTDRDPPDRPEPLPVGAD